MLWFVDTHKLTVLDQVLQVCQRFGHCEAHLMLTEPVVVEDSVAGFQRRDTRPRCFVHLPQPFVMVSAQFGDPRLPVGDRIVMPRQRHVDVQVGQRLQ